MKKAEVEVMEARGACCLATAGVEGRLKSLEIGEILEVVLDEGMYDTLTKLTEDQDCEVLETNKKDKAVRIRLRKKRGEEKRAENCMVCGTTLEYLETATSVVCTYCGREETGYVRCSKGHYVCDECHGKGAFELVRDIALTTDEKDPLAIAELLMAHPKIPFLGCEHGLIATASLLAALKNDATLDISNEQLIEAMKRTQKQAMPSYCALTGVCGVPIGIGAAFSVILGAACPKDRESAITMHIVARTVDTIANDVGPMCCKSFVRTALGVGYNSAKEYFDIHLPIHREKISCFHSNKNHRNCRKNKCLYFPKTA